MLAADPVGKPITEAECQATAAAIAQAVRTGDRPALDRVIDWNALYQRSTAGVEAPATFKPAFIQGLTQAQNSPRGFSATLLDAAKKGGTYTLIHVHTKDQRRRLMFRLLLPEAGVNYHDLLLARRPDGRVGVEDIYVSMSGDLMSQTFRRLYVMAVAQASGGGLIGKLMGTDQKYAKFFKDLNAMNQAHQAGDYAKVLNLYEGLPPELRKDKAVLLIRLQAAQQIGEAEYARSMEDFRAEHPNDPSINLLSIDYHLLKKQYRESLACVDRVDKAVLGDPYLLTIRAAIRLELDDLAAAQADARKAIAAEPTLVEAYWSLVTVSLRAKDHAKTLKTLRQIRDKFHLPIGDLTTVPLYEDFVKSPQYQQWLKDGQDEDKAADKTVGAN